jgi:hypothetical protein
MTDKKETLEKEVNVNFNVQIVRVTNGGSIIGNGNEYRKIRIVIDDEELGEIRHEQVLSDLLTVNNILKKIAELHKVYRLTQNQKLKEGAKEEILKLIALLIETLGE